MALFSKMDSCIANKTCQELLHPFTSSCTMATLDLVLAAGYGSAKFMAIIYLLSFLLKLSRGKKEATPFFSLKNLTSFLRSVLYGATAGVLFMITNCSTRWLIGGFHDLTCCFLPSFVGGLAIILESPARRNIVVTSYANMALDAMLRRLEELGLLSWSKSGLTLTFMLLNAALLYLRRFGDANDHSVWFFTPDETDADFSILLPKLKKQFLHYFLAGLAVSAARLIFSNLYLTIHPVTLLGKLLTIRNLSLGAFLGTYVTTYQVADHFLKDLPANERTVLAGLLSGMTLWLQPSRSILVSAAINIFQIVLEIYQRSGKIPKLPYYVLLFCFYNGFLYQMRAANPSAVSRTFIRIMSLATTKRSDKIYQYYLDLVKAAA